MTTRISTLRLALLLALVAAVPSLASAQQPTPAPTPAPTTAAPVTPGAPRVRRTVEIRAQAPAPEVITVRPREVPQYTRRLLVPALITYADTTGAGRAPVVAPAPAHAEARAAAASDRRTPTP